MYRASDGASGIVVADRLRSADTHWTRLRGLLGTSGLAPGEGLWIRPCRQILRKQTQGKSLLLIRQLRSPKRKNPQRATRQKKRFRNVLL